MCPCRPAAVVTHGRVSHGAGVLRVGCVRTRDLQPILQIRPDENRRSSIPQRHSKSSSIERESASCSGEYAEICDVPCDTPPS